MEAVLPPMAQISIKSKPTLSKSSSKKNLQTENESVYSYSQKGKVARSYIDNLLTNLE